MSLDVSTWFNYGFLCSHPVFSKSSAKQEIWLLVAAIGVGCLFQPPLIGS